jgi:hypothetical protein
MTDSSHNLPEECELLAPQGLIDDLRSLHAAGDVPRSVDEAVLTAVRPWFIRQRRRRLILRFTIIGAGAAAAGILLLATFLPPGVLSRTRSALRPASDAYVEAPPAQIGTASDVPSNRVAPASAAVRGRVTILDAFALARHLKAGDAMQAEWDTNHDGVVDRKDVDALAMAAVRVVGGS